MKKTIEATIVMEVEATNQEVLDEVLFNLELYAQVLDLEILDWCFNYSEPDSADQRVGD